MVIRVEVWENEKYCGNMIRTRVFPQLFRVLPNFHKCYHIFMETKINAREIFLLPLGARVVSFLFYKLYILWIIQCDVCSFEIPIPVFVEGKTAHSYYFGVHVFGSPSSKDVLKWRAGSASMQKLGNECERGLLGKGYIFLYATRWTKTFKRSEILGDGAVSFWRCSVPNHFYMFNWFDMITSRYETLSISYQH